MRARFTLFIGIISALLTLFLSGMAGNAMYELLCNVWFPVWAKNKGFVALSVVSALAVSFLILFYNRRAFQGVRSLKHEICKKPHPCLVIFLSPPGRAVFTDKTFSITLDGKKLLNTLDEDINLLDGTRWPWQQMLRGLRPHGKGDTLKHVYLIGSLTTSIAGSYDSLIHAEQMIKNYFPHVKVETYSEPVHFENFDDIVDVLTDVIRALTRHGYKEKQIIVDVTGGQKITSIAGAVVTFNSGVTFQYVQTDQPYDVLKYDVVVESAPSL